MKKLKSESIVVISILILSIITSCNISSLKQENKMTDFEKAQEIKEKIVRGDFLIGLLDAKDIDLMFELYNASAKSGNPKGWYELGMLYYGGIAGDQDPDLEKAVSYFKLAGESGYGIDAWIQYLRIAYFNDLTSIDLNEIIDLIKKLEKEDTDGEIYLLKGYMLYRGYAYTQNLESSYQAHLKAAEKGNAEAMFELHVYFANGIGVDEDFQKSLDWCIKAAENNNTRAVYNLGAYYATGYRELSIDTDKAISYYKKAAHLGHGKAAAQLAAMYTMGVEVEKNEKLAKEFYELSFENNFDVAIFFEDLGLQEINIED